MKTKDLMGRLVTYPVIKPKHVPSRVEKLRGQEQKKEERKMALTWDWKDKTGYVTMKVGEKMYNYPMYKCNALMMWIGKQKIDGEDNYYLAGMFADVPHMNRCLGLVKGHTNLYESGNCDIVKLTMLGDTPYKNEIIKAFFKAFKNITISVVDTLPMEEK